MLDGEQLVVHPSLFSSFQLSVGSRQELKCEIIPSLMRSNSVRIAWDHLLSDRALTRGLPPTKLICRISGDERGMKAEGRTQMMKPSLSNPKKKEKIKAKAQINQKEGQGSEKIQPNQVPCRILIQRNRYGHHFQLLQEEIPELSKATTGASRASLILTLAHTTSSDLWRLFTLFRGKG